eukprot:39929-Hanusia_phi.AAC.1
MQIYFTGGSEEQVDRRCPVFSNLRRDRMIVQRGPQAPSHHTGRQGDTQAFAHGQLYVACSRVGNPRHLYVHAPDGLIIGRTCCTDRYWGDSETVKH